MNTLAPLIALGDQFVLTVRPPNIVLLNIFSIGITGALVAIWRITSSLRNTLHHVSGRMPFLKTVVLFLVLGVGFATGITGLRHWTYMTCPDDFDEVVLCGVVTNDDQHVTWTKSGQQVTYIVTNGPESSFWHPEYIGTVTEVENALLVRDITDNDPVDDVRLLRDIEILTGPGSIIVANDHTLNDRTLFTIQFEDAHLVVDASDGSRQTLRVVRFRDRIAYYEEEAS